MILSFATSYIAKISCASGFIPPVLNFPHFIKPVLTSTLCVFPSRIMIMSHEALYKELKTSYPLNDKSMATFISLIKPICLVFIFELGFRFLKLLTPIPWNSKRHLFEQNFLSDLSFALRKLLQFLFKHFLFIIKPFIIDNTIYNNYIKRATSVSRRFIAN